MDNFPEALKLEIQAYMKPGEILSQYLHTNQNLISSNEISWNFWSKQSRITFNITLLDFKDTSLSPYERYLQLFTEHGGLDYGSEKYGRVETCTYYAFEEGNLSLVKYFFEKIKELKIRELFPFGCPFEYRNRDVVDLYVNTCGLSKVVGRSSNFSELLAFLLEHGLDKRNIEQAWIIYFIKEGRYDQAFNLIRCDHPSSRGKSLASIALEEALNYNNLPLMERLIHDFKSNLPDREDYLNLSITTNDPDIVRLMIKHFYHDDRNILLKAYDRARHCDMEEVSDWIKEELRLFK